jgi:hypothetical protein
MNCVRQSFPKTIKRGMSMEIILALAVVFTLYLFFSKKPKSPPKAQSLPPAASNSYPGPTPAFHWPYRGFDFEVVGESFYQSNLRALAGNHGDDFVGIECKAILYPDDANEHDNKAVAVYIDNHQVGNLSRGDARSFRRRLAARRLTGQATSADAIIGGGGIRNGERCPYGVWFDMTPFE